MKTRNLVLAGCLVVGLTGCADMSSTERHTAEGAGIGAVAGALIGGLATGRPLTGLAVGAAAGAGGGYLYDRHEKAKDD